VAAVGQTDDLMDMTTTMTTMMRLFRLFAGRGSSLFNLTVMVLVTQLVLNRWYLLSSNRNDHYSSQDTHRCDDLFSTALSALLPSSSSSKQTTTQVDNPYCSHVLGEKQIWNDHKKIISYSIFGPSITTNTTITNTTTNSTITIINHTITLPFPEWVLHGMERNIIDAQYYYPDWIVRVYAFDLPKSVQDRWLIHNASIFHNVEVVPCHSSSPMAKSNSRKMISRLLAYDDPKVWYTLVRDADSRISLREVMAVHEFLKVSMGVDNRYKFSTRQEEPSSTTTTSPTSSSSFDPSSIYLHLMRDHEGHIVPIMGGMLGMKRGLLSFVPHPPPLNHNTNNDSPQHGPTTMSQLLQHAFRLYGDDFGGCCGEDQEFLRRHIWPYVKHVTLDHDIDHRRCRDFESKLCYDFPLGPRDESIDYFVGAAFKTRENATTEWQVLPKQHTCTLQCNLTDETDLLWEY
jgi:hypothetical protein